MPKRILIALLVGLCLLGIAGSAPAVGILPAITNSYQTNVSWATWDETTESGWGDNTNTYIALFENTAAGGNETGVGLESGVSLVLTQAGNVAGAIGSPPTRALDGTDDVFTMVSDLSDNLQSSTWTLFLKVKDINLATDGGFFHFYRAAGTDNINVYQDGDALHVEVTQGGVAKLNATTAENLPGSGDCYIAVWCDGTYVRAGFSFIKPTAWGDFASARRMSATASATFAASFDQYRQIGRRSADVEGDFDAYYFVLSKSCLIDNSL